MTPSATDRSIPTCGEATSARRRPRRLGAWVALATVMAASSLLGYREIFGPDVGFHLESGRWVVEHGWPRTDPLTYTGAARPYVDLQWLYQLGLYGLYRTSGTAGMVIANILLTLISFGLLVLRATRRQGQLSLGAVGLILLFSLGNLWDIRPHVLSWFYLNVMLLLFEEYERGAFRALWFIPPTMLLWANSHSLFVLGWLVMAVYGARELFKGRQADRRLLVWVALGFAICIMTPYGTTGLAFPFRQYIQLMGESVFKSATHGIAEFRSPWNLRGYSANGAWVWLQPLLFMQSYAIVVSASAATGRRCLKWVDLVLLVLFGWLFFKAEKNFGYFAVATLPSAAVGLAQWGQRARTDKMSLAAAATVVAVCAVLARLVTNGFWYAQERLPNRFGQTFNEDLLPIRAGAFLARAPGCARMLNTFDDGGYLRLATGWPVFLDGRTEVAGPAFYRYYVGLQSPQALTGAVTHWRLNVAVVPLSTMPAWFMFFSEAPGWRCVYADERDLVFARDDCWPSLPAIGAPRADIDYRQFPTAQVDRLLQKAKMFRYPNVFAALAGQHYYPIRELRSTALCLMRNFPEAAIGHGLEGVERMTIPCPEILVNLFVAFLESGDLRRARMCHDALPVRLRNSALSRELERQESAARER